MEIRENTDDNLENMDVDLEDNPLFPKCDYLIEEQVVKSFILHLDVTKETCPNVLVNTAKKRSVLYNMQNNGVNKLHSIDCESVLIGCKFSVSSRDLFYIGSEDGCINVMDLRTPGRPSLQFKDTTVEDGKSKTFNCFDVSPNDRLLTAGTDLIGGDAFILFWDIRKQNVLGGYWESHTDDITQVKFHPEDMNSLISGSIDGLINIYDLSQRCEDDALTDTFNTEESVDQLSWIRNNNKYNISCITHTSDVQLWDRDQGEVCNALTKLDVANNISKYVDNVYVANCHETESGVLLLAGSENPHCLRSLKLGKKNVNPGLEFSSNKQRVRDSSFIETNNLLVTGGEDGILNVWKVPVVN
ncbi:unnamed protein product [Phyllotreta striolata]|uniref:WD repeat-containing protein 89 n=1 Tax=Phyllotreta striolata TaxID=444603 RepID=A0A9N9TZ09_PHYSR|nr:unnamed protein product [Phyllotreta striolata]